MNQFAVKTWWGKLPIALVVVVGLVVGASGLLATPVAAAPAHAQTATSVSVHEISKTILPQTSIDGPAFSSLSDYVPNPSTYPPNSYPATAIAWAGTDPQHFLYLTYAPDGLTYSNPVVRLPESSTMRPAVLLYNNNHIGTLPPTLIVLAWTGTDQNHSLNVMFDVLGVRQKLILQDNSLSSPALAYFNGQVWLAWTGTDPGHSLNVMAMGPDGVTPGAKTILRGDGFSSRSGPSLREDRPDNLLLLTWTVLSSPAYIDLAQSSDGVTWATSFSPPPPQTSNTGPDVMSIPTGQPTDYWTWTGTDDAHSLNIAYTSTLASWPAPIITLDEQAMGSPELGYSSKLKNSGVVILLAWAGTDPAHHLNVAAFQIG